MNFITLTFLDNTKVDLNLNRVAAIFTIEKGTQILFSNATDDYFIVKESKATIFDMLGNTSFSFTRTGQYDRL